MKMTHPEKIARERAGLWEDIENIDLDEDYPRDLDLHPKSDLTKFIIQEIHNRAEVAHEELSKCTEDYRASDWTQGAYMPADEHDAGVMQLDSRKPVTCVVPISFSVKEMMQAAMMSVFGGPIIHRYKGMGSAKAHISAAKRERVVARHSDWFKERLKLDMCIGSALQYGRGFVALNWTKKFGSIPVTEEISDSLSTLLQGQGLEKGDIIRYLGEEVQLQEGTELVNLDIYQMLLDPNRDVNTLQKSEFIGWMYRTSAQDLMRRSRDPEERLFNAPAVRKLAAQGGSYSVWWNRDDGRGTLGESTAPTEGNAELAINPVDVIQMYIDIIPSEWGLGDEDYCQKWMFAVAGDRVVIQAEPLRLSHGMYPVAGCAPNADGVKHSPVSHLFMIREIQRFADWLMKSRQDAVRTILNGLIFFDPSKVDPDDILNPGMGKLVRVRPGSYSEGGIQQYVHQMQISDPTVNHMAGIMQLDQIARNGIGAGDMVAGQMGDMPERPTSQGIQVAAQATSARLQLLAKRIDEQMMTDIAWQMAMNLPQFMSADVAAPILGSLEQELRKDYGIEGDNEDIMVGFKDLEFPFTCVPHTDANPEITNMAGMTEVLKTLLSVEGVGAEVAGGLRLVDLYINYMRKNGLDNIDDFRAAMPAGVPGMNVQSMPDEQVQQGVQAGNLVPMQ